MFNWFKRNSIEQPTATVDMISTVPEPTATPLIPEIEEPKVIQLDSTEAEYTIGVNQAGNTQLRIRLDHGSAVLTMSSSAVHKMIRQLRATLEDDEVKAE